MKNFLYKEFKLCLAPVNYLFLLSTTMILIPNYPCYVPFFYLCLSVFFIFNNSELNKDIPYSMILPIKKSDIVKSRCILVATYEFIGILFTIPFALIKNTLIKIPNNAGIECNIAFYGFILIVLSIFNFVFFSMFYKKGEKPGIPFFIASIVFWFMWFIFELPIWSNEFLKNSYFLMLDSVTKESSIKQLPILFIGIIIYVIGWFFTFKISSKKFNKIDL